MKPRITTFSQNAVALFLILFYVLFTGAAEARGLQASAVRLPVFREGIAPVVETAEPALEENTLPFMPELPRVEPVRLFASRTILASA